MVVRPLPTPALGTCIASPARGSAGDAIHPVLQLVRVGASQTKLMAGKKHHYTSTVASTTFLTTPTYAHMLAKSMLTVSLLCSYSSTPAFSISHSGRDPENNGRGLFYTPHRTTPTFAIHLTWFWLAIWNGRGF